MAKIPFFQYLVMQGRRTLAYARRCPAATENCWKANNILDDFMCQFWKQFWAQKQAAKVTSFHWLLAHWALPVGAWMRRIGKQVVCPRCGHSDESLAHCLWTCQVAIQVWCRILKIFEKSEAHLMVSWGLAAWATFSRDVEHFDPS